MDMINVNSEKELEQFFYQHLNKVVLPFWLNNGIDKKNGGYYTCFDNLGKNLISTDKYTWSQGRLIWVWAKLYQETGNEKFLMLAENGVNFVLDNCFLENGYCAFLVDEEGNKKEPVKGLGYDFSNYADCFVAMGLAKFAEVSGKEDVFERSISLYDLIIKRINGGDFKSQPYPVPKGYKSHGIPMIALNTGQVLAEAMDKFNDDRIEELQKSNKFFVEEIMNNFERNNLIYEMVGKDNKIKKSILGQYINPGHTIEDMSFIMQYAKENNRNEIIERVVQIMKHTFKVGWDEQFGGLFQFIGVDGYKPSGNEKGIEDSEMVKKLKNNWDNKLWWPHSEALYSFYFAYTLTNDKELFNLFEIIFNYTFSTFPNPNKQVGEWIQIRNREGKPVEKIVALPVKDPYHILKNLILLNELLKEDEYIN